MVVTSHASCMMLESDAWALANSFILCKSEGLYSFPGQNVRDLLWPQRMDMTPADQSTLFARQAREGVQESDYVTKAKHPVPLPKESNVHWLYGCYQSAGEDFWLLILHGFLSCLGRLVVCSSLSYVSFAGNVTCRALPNIHSFPIPLAIPP